MTNSKTFIFLSAVLMHSLPISHTTPLVNVPSLNSDELPEFNQTLDETTTFLENIFTSIASTKMATKSLSVLSTTTEIKIDTSPTPTNDYKEAKIASEMTRNRQPLKLYPKQKILMNQVIQAYALTDVVNNSLCKSHSEEFAIGLRAFEAWALKMFDSSSKLPAGIFNGNLLEFGSFTQCINIQFDSEDHGTIRGQQCLLKITPTENIVRKILAFREVSEERFNKIYKIVKNAGLAWSVCVPDSCRPEDVQSHFNKTILSITQGLDLEISLTDLDCFSLKDVKPLGPAEWATILILAAIALIVIVSTVIDVLARNNDGKSENKLAQIFSAYANTEYILSNSNPVNTMGCLNGIRFISILYIILGHRFTVMLFFPSANSLEITEWLLTFGSAIITGATVSVDTFFMLSGLLVSYYLCDQLQKGQKFRLWYYLFHRYIRITPPLAVCVLILATLANRFGSGPIWKQTSYAIQTPCQYLWWSSILHLQNYINPKHFCILQTWYLTCDMQFYIFAPILVIPLFKWPKIGLVNCAVFFALSVGINFYAVWQNKYEPTGLIDNTLPSSDYFAHYYVKPYNRPPTYIIGIILGYILFRTRDSKIRIGKSVLIMGWITSTAIVLSLFKMQQIFQSELHSYNRLESSIFLSLFRSAWTLCMAWMVWVCFHGYGGIVNSFLSAHFFTVMGKLTYAMFLIHLEWQFLWIGSTKVPMYFSTLEIVTTFTARFFSDVLIVVFPSYLLTICVEGPIVRAENMFFRRGNKKLEDLGTNNKINIAAKELNADRGRVITNNFVETQK